MANDSEPRLFPASANQGAFVSNDREWIIREVENGLRNHRGRLAEAIENQAFYDLDSERYAQRREAETEFDFAGRPRRQSGLMLQAVDRLTEHNYNPGPVRTVVGDGLAESLMTQVYEDTHIDCLMAEADVLAAVNDVCAIEVKATNIADKPVDLQLWGGDEFTVFVDPDDPRMASAVVTIDRFNQRTRYRLWFDDEVHTYLTDQYSTDKTAGALVARRQGAPEPNTYGCIPFAFMPYRPQVRSFWSPGPGTFLRKAELRVNDRLSELDELIMKYARPIGVFKNVGPAFTPEVGPGRFLRLVRGGTGYTGEGYGDTGEPSAEYLQATLAIQDIWVDLEKYIKQTANAIDLPWSALELEYSDAPSGVSLIIKTAPLLLRAKKRRKLYQMVELALARVILTAAGNHYGHADLVSQAQTLQLLLAWAEPRIPVPGPERDQSDEWEMQVGLKSRITVCMERYGLTHDQAVEQIKQVAKDEEQIKDILPQELTPVGSATMPSEEQDARQADQMKAAAATKSDDTDPEEDAT